MKEQDQDYEGAISYLDMAVKTGNDLCLIKCCKEIYDCLLLMNLTKKDVESFCDKYSGDIFRLIEKEKSNENCETSPVWVTLQELGKNMWTSPNPNDWILKKMGIKDERRL